MAGVEKDIQYYKFCLYGFIKNLKFFDPYLILFFREMEITFLQIGVLFSVREIVTNLMEIPSGMIADVVGRRRAMVFSFTSYIAAFLVFFLMPDFSAYIGAMALFGLGEAFRSGTHKAMILEYLRRKGILHLKVHYYGHTRGWSQAGSSLSAILAALLVFHSGSYRNVFLYSIIPYMLDLILLLSYPRELDGITGDGCLSWSKTRKRFAAVFRDFTRTLRNPAVRRALLTSSLYDGFFETVKDYLQPLLKQMAMALPVFLMWEGGQRVTVVVGMVYALLYVFTALAARGAGAFSERFPRIAWALNSSYLLAAGVMGLAGFLVISNESLGAVILLIAFYIMKNLRRPLALGFLSERISSGIMATGLSGESQAKTLFIAILAPCMGFMADRWGIGAGLAAMAVAATLLFPLVRVGSPEE